MKVLYTSHLCGDRTTMTQRIIECDDLLEHIADEAGISSADLTHPTAHEAPNSFVHNEHGVFITATDCIESWVFIS